MRRPEIAREITTCWTCSVLSKMSKVCRRRSASPDPCNRADRGRQVRLGPVAFAEF